MTRKEKELLPSTGDGWIDVVDFDRYEIHKDLGIRRKGKQTPLKGRNWLGYPKVTLMRGGKKHEKRIHKLVGEHFVPNPNGLPIVNHDDSDRSNHASSNLSWVSESGNQLHRWKTQKERLSKKKYMREYDNRDKAKTLLTKNAGSINGKTFRRLKALKALKAKGLTPAKIKEQALNETYKQHGMNPIRRAINLKMPFNNVIF